MIVCLSANAFRKFLAVYQQVTSTKCIFFESDMYFSVVSWDIRGNCCNFALGNQKNNGLSPALPRREGSPMLIISEYVSAGRQTANPL